MSDENEEIRGYIRDSNRRIEKLELAIKNSPPNSHLREQIKALENKFDVWRNEANNMITELKETVEMVNNRIQIFIGDEGK